MKKLQWAYSVIRNAVDEDYFGTITLSFRAGTVELAKYERTEKPPVDAI